MPRYQIGIDTGGTYTDAVIVDRSSKNVIAGAKSLTSHGNLAQGVMNSLKQVLDAADDVTPSDIQQVSLSTTLATNALVEGRGSSIAVILIGFDEAMRERTRIATAIPDATVVTVAGGHKYDGQEQNALDENAVRKICHRVAVDAFAVASHYAVRNPSHEQRASELVQELTGKPVSASCDLSDSLNGPLRALTAAFNARIISLIVSLAQAVADSMDHLGIDAPLMIVKGDGSVAAVESVLNRPIETILSGPAASIVGARFLTGLENFVVADMGGTTTDVATVVDGWPRLNARGANIGGFHTLVEAVDMQTTGLGGDSRVRVDESGLLSIDSTRVVPISMLASVFPAIENELITALGKEFGLRSALDYLVLNVDYTAIPVDGLTQKEQRFLQSLDPNTPQRYNDIVHSASDRACATVLLGRGLLHRSGFTPSDAAHVLGLQSQWPVSAARLAATVLTRTDYRTIGRDEEHTIDLFCREVVDAVVENSTRIALSELSGRAFNADDVLASVSAGRTYIKNLDIRVCPRVPLVAVGGPASVFYPDVGKRLNTDVHIPTHSRVANAVGAAVGVVRARYVVEVALDEGGGYRIYTSADPEFIQDAAGALRRARDLAKRGALDALLVKGGQTDRVNIDVERVQTPGLDDVNGLISAKVIASCDSLPDLKAVGPT